MLAEWYEKPNSHCKFAIAQDATGKECSEHSIHVAQMCIVGALSKFYPDTYYITKRKLETVINPTGDEKFDIVNWNNAPERTQEEVYDACLKAGI